jgi:hypothetical protein
VPFLVCRSLLRVRPRAGGAGVARLQDDIPAARCFPHGVAPASGPVAGPATGRAAGCGARGPPRAPGGGWPAPHQAGAWPQRARRGAPCVGRQWHGGVVLAPGRWSCSRSMPRK